MIEAGPADAEALNVVYRALEHPSAREKAAALLERAATCAEDNQQALVILQELLRLPRVAALDAARRRWFESLLDLQQGDPHVALDTALAAVGEVPDDEGLWTRAEKLARNMEQPALVASAYHRVLSSSEDPKLASKFGRRAVDYQEEWFDDPPAVIALLRRVLELSPDAHWARDRLKLAYGSAERWDDFFDLDDDAIERASDATARAELLARPPRPRKISVPMPIARSELERLSVVRAHDPRVTSLLERLYEKQERIQPLIDLLLSELALLTGEEAQRMRLRIAGLRLHKKRDEVAAFRLVGQALESEATRGEAFALLEDIVFRPYSEANRCLSRYAERRRAPGHAGSAPPSPTASSSYPSLPARVRSPISPPRPPLGLGDLAGPQLVPPPVRRPARHRPAEGATSGAHRPCANGRRCCSKKRDLAQSKHHDLARVLEVELSLAANAKIAPADTKILLTLMHETQRTTTRGALRTAWARFRRSSRGSLPYRVTLGALAERLGAVGAVRRVLVNTAESSTDTPLLARLPVEAGQIYRDKVGDAGRAIELFGGAGPQHQRPRARALDGAALDTLLERAARHEERCGVLESISSSSPQKPSSGERRSSSFRA